MTMPSLPTDTLSRLLVIGCIIGLVGFFSIQWNDDTLRTRVLQLETRLRDSGQFYSAEIERLKAMEFNYEWPPNFGNATSLSSLAASGSQVFVLKGDTLKALPGKTFSSLQNPNLAQASTLFPKLSPEEQKRQDSIDHMKSRIASMQQERDARLGKLSGDISDIGHQLRRNTLIRYGVTTIALIFLSLGLARWWRTDRWKERILFQEYVKALGRDVPCQSCGMQLKFDKDHQEEDIYCHACHDGYDFTDPAMTIKLMKQKISDQMKVLGFNRWQIWKHNRKLKSYTRWAKVFKWQEHEQAEIPESEYQV